MKRMLVLVLLVATAACAPADNGPEEPQLDDGVVAPGEQ